MLLRTRLAAALAVIVVIAGCAAPSGSDSSPVSSRAPSETPATVTSDTNSSAAVDDTGAVDRTAAFRWTAVRKRIPAGSSVVAAYDGRYLAAAITRDGRRASITDTRTGRRVISHKVTGASNWIVRDMYLADPWVLIVEAPMDGGGIPATKAVVYDLRSGRQRTPPTSLPTAAQPEPYDADESRFVYSTRSGKRSCLAVVPFQTMRARLVGCVGRGQLIGRPSIASDELAAMVRTTRGKPCAYPILIDLGAVGSRPERTPQRKRCSNFGAAVADSAVATLEIAIGASDLTQAKVWGLSRGTALTPLGPGVAASAVGCGGWLYWSRDDDRAQVAEIRRWRPGQGVQVVYRSPDPGWFTTSAVQCDGGFLRLFRNWTGGGAEKGAQLLVTRVRS